MKEKIEKFKKIWKNPRSHALIILGCYLIFFCSISIISNTSTKRKNKNQQVVQEQKKDYKFEIEVNDEKINGEKINEKILFNYNGILYEYINNVINPDDFVYSDVLYYLDIDNLIKIEEKEERFSKTEFNDGSIETVYIIDDKKVSLSKNKNEIVKTILIINDTEYKILYK